MEFVTLHQIIIIQKCSINLWHKHLLWKCLLRWTRINIELTTFCCHGYIFIVSYYTVQICQFHYNKHYKLCLWFRWFIQFCNVHNAIISYSYTQQEIWLVCLRQDMTYCGNEEERRNICRMERERKMIEHCCINNALITSLFSIRSRWMKYGYMKWLWQWRVEVLRKNLIL
jgi:hypothetical protein